MISLILASLALAGIVSALVAWNMGLVAFAHAVAHGVSLVPMALYVVAGLAAFPFVLGAVRARDAVIHAVHGDDSDGPMADVPAAAGDLPGFWADG